MAAEVEAVVPLDCPPGNVPELPHGVEAGELSGRRIMVVTGHFPNRRIVAMKCGGGEFLVSVRDSAFYRVGDRVAVLDGGDGLVDESPRMNGVRRGGGL